MDKSASYEQRLLKVWEEVFKKGQLTLWILLALKDGSKHMAEIKNFIDSATNGTMKVDDQSMYRALRRYQKADLVDFKYAPGESGPDLKVYHLTSTGTSLLGSFIGRNIAEVFYKPEIVKLIKGE